MSQTDGRKDDTQSQYLTLQYTVHRAAKMEVTYTDQGLAPIIGSFAVLG